MTKSEQAIQELWRTVATLEERIDHVRSDIKALKSDLEKVEEKRSKSADGLIEIDRRIVSLEEVVKELKKERETTDGRQWTIVVTVISCLLTLAVQFLELLENCQVSHSFRETGPAVSTSSPFRGAVPGL